MMISMGLMWTLYGNIATFYPPYRSIHHSSITDMMVGTILALFEVAIMIGSPIVSLIMPKIGRKNCIILGNLFMVIASYGFGLLVYVYDDTWFFTLSLILRFIQGLGEACASTAMFSIVGTEFSKDRDWYIGYLEFAVGLGLMGGPVIGQLFYTILGFEKTFYAMGIMIGIPMFF